MEAETCPRMSELKQVTTQLTFRVSLRQRLILDRASRVTKRSLSDFIRLAVMPAAEDAVVADAIKTPTGDDT